MRSPLESRLGYTFQNSELLKLALTHASWAHEHKKQLPHNERLEFLGDAVLELVTSDHLFHTLSEIEEGLLTKIRAHLVNRSALVEIAKGLDLGPHLVLGEAEALQGGRVRPSNLANAMEAIIGAVFLDGGYQAARDFVIPLIEFRLKKMNDNPEPENAKGILQEKLHAVGNQAVYRIISETGPPHQKEFKATVEIDGEIVGTGIGRTKKEAEMQAAGVALKHLKNNIK